MTYDDVTPLLLCSKDFRAPSGPDRFADRSAVAQLQRACQLHSFGILSRYPGAHQPRPGFAAPALYPHKNLLQ